MIASPVRIAVLACLASLALAPGCASLPDDVEREASYALEDTEDTALGRIRRSEREAHPGQSGFHLLESGIDAFVARVELARRAERTLDVQYYLYHADLAGRLLGGELLAAADRGVRVRILIDDMDLEGRDRSLTAFDSHPNAELRVFNPFSREVGRLSQFITRAGSVTRRMHNKSFIADNQVAILGGRNIGDEYFDADPEIAFRDLDVAAIGPVVREVSAVFDLYWNSELAYPATALRGRRPTPKETRRERRRLEEFVARKADSEYVKAMGDSAMAERIRTREIELFWGDGEVLYDRPEKILHDFDRTELHLSPQLRAHFESVADELIIISPYFVPGEDGTRLLCDLRRRGVRVQVFTNSLASTDVGIVHSGYAKYRKTLLRYGVELYEMNPGGPPVPRPRAGSGAVGGSTGSSSASLHTKSFVFDRERLFVGSVNMDPRSSIHNTEIGVVIHCEELARRNAEDFDRQMEDLAFRLELFVDGFGRERILWHGWVDGRRRTLDEEPFTGPLRGLGIELIGLLPIESQL